MSRYKSLVAIGTAITIAISGCVQTGDTKSKQFAVQGCAVGGLGAGVVTYLANLNDKDANKKALIAGMLGCMAGAVVGYQIGKRTEVYADAQHAARSEIARNEEHTIKLQQNNAQLAQNIEEYNTQISHIKDINYSEQEKMKKLKEVNEIVTQQRIKATDTLKSVEADIAESNKLYNTYHAEALPQDKDKWAAEIADYEQEKEILSGHVSTLNALDASI
ncbi:MAG: hypothetical protein ABFS45_08665 [Pseudomonadota bacterium]